MKKWIFASAVTLTTLLPLAHATPFNSHRLPDIAFNNLRYQYFVHSPRFMMEAKILSAFQQHPTTYAAPNITDQIKQAYNLKPITQRIGLPFDEHAHLIG